MSKILQIARTEMLEHRRQPSMIGVLVVNYLVWIGIFGVVFLLLDQALSQPDVMVQVRRQSQAMGVDLDAMVGLLVSTWGSLVYTNLPLFVAIMSGYSVLHDRTTGTLPFLMLAPITRRQVLMGKLMGAIAIPFLLHLVFVGSSSLLLGQLDLVAPWADKLGDSPAWWLAFLVGAPASAALVGAVGTVISALSGDVRTSMQYTSFFIGLISLAIGYALVDGVSWGMGLQLAFALACLVGALLILLVGARIISRDIVPS